MTVSTTTSRISYTEDGVSTVFPVPFRFLADADLVVERIIAGVVTVLALTTDYTVAGADAALGGSITRTAATNGATLRIRRQTPRTQSMVYSVGDDFPAESHERALDRLTLIAQEADAAEAETEARALRVPAGEIAAEVPAPRLNVGKFLASAAAGALLWASGTGADAGLREDLAAPTGSMLVGHDSGLLDAEARSQATINKERVPFTQFWHAVDTDHTNAACRAVAYANATGGNVDFDVPRGGYVISGPVTPILVEHVAFVGGHSAGSLLYLSYNGPTFTWKAYGGGLANLRFIYEAAPPANAVVMLMDGSDSQHIRYCEIKNVRTLAQQGTATSNANVLMVRGLTGYWYNGGSPLFKLYGGAGFFCGQTNVYVDGVPPPATNRTSTMVTASGTSFLALGGKIFDTIRLESGVMIERAWRALDLTTFGTSVVTINVFVDPTTICDYIADTCYQLDSQAGAGGIVTVQIAGYANSWSGQTVRLKAESNIKFVVIDKITSPFSGYETVLLDGATGAKQVIVRGGFYCSPNRLNASRAALRVTNADELIIDGVAAGIDGTPEGVPWTGQYGISIAADLPRYQVTGCWAHGVTKNYDFPANSSPSGDRLISDNRNVDYAGWQPNSGVWLRPQSPTGSWTNKTAFRVMAYVNGGTPSSVHNGLYQVSSGECTVLLAPGDTLAYDCVSAPNAPIFYVLA